jgi:hypothetical protein
MFNRKAKQAKNEYGVINVLFYTACNLVGEHGMVRVSNKKLGLTNASVSFFLKDNAEAPAFTPRLFNELEAAAESQGYVLHELISYVRLEPSLRAAQQHVESLEERHMRPSHTTTPPGVILFGGGMREGGVLPAGQQSSFGSLRHNEVSGEVGAELLRRTGTIPQTEHREPFDLHSLNRGTDFSMLDVPTWMRNESKSVRSASALLDTAINQLVCTDERAWPLSPKKVVTYLPHLTQEQREELQNTALLLAAKTINDPSKHEALLADLATLADRFVEMPASTAAK